MAQDFLSSSNSERAMLLMVMCIVRLDVDRKKQQSRKFSSQCGLMKVLSPLMWKVWKRNPFRFVFLVLLGSAILEKWKTDQWSLPLRTLIDCGVQVEVWLTYGICWEIKMPSLYSVCMSSLADQRCSERWTSSFLANKLTERRSQSRILYFRRMFSRQSMSKSLFCTNIRCSLSYTKSCLAI